MAILGLILADHEIHGFRSNDDLHYAISYSNIFAYHNADKYIGTRKYLY